MLGRLIAKCIIDPKFQIGISFTKSFLKHITNQTLVIQDIEDIDASLSQQLKWILENDVTDLDLTYSMNQDICGQIVEISLIPNGNEIPVTNENKKEYVKTFCQTKMTYAIKQQLESFLLGIYDIIPKQAFALLNANDLGLLLAGMPNFDIEDLKANTTYVNYKQNDDVIGWFWETMKSLKDSQLAEFLFFYSGSYKIPVGGFTNMPLKIIKTYDDAALLTAHTCFYEIEMPEYQTKDELEEKLMKSITEGLGGFYID
eukprot:TRINITY_DN14452_c0_g1_i4.p1 TRINITY_DN14452_c0_g1~~TRINITY_DN14452_c0_g1_i4.p1  ORF type:complete len:258 (-),score=55.90 TRINITY_DN14452_c0_g1_i4:104-877(-)